MPIRVMGQFAIFFPDYWLRGAFHSQKISYTLGKNPFLFKKNPSKIRINPFVLKKSRTLFPMSEVPLDWLYFVNFALAMGLLCGNFPQSRVNAS